MADDARKPLDQVTNELRLPRWARYVRELLAIALWGLALVHVLIVNVASLLLPWPGAEPLIRYRFLIVLGGIALFWVILKTPRFVAFVGYIVFYPIVCLVWKVPRSLWRNWPTALVFLPAIQTALAGFRLNFAFLIFAVIAAAVTIRAHGTLVLSASMLILAFYLVWHFIRRIHRVFVPSTVFTNVGKTVQNFWEYVRKSNDPRVLQQHEPGSAAYESAFGQQILNLYVFSTALARVATRLQEIHASRRLDLYFAGSLLYSFMLTVVVFALTYFGISKVDPSAFSSRAGLLEYLGYSFGTITHYQLSAIVPLSGLAQFVTYAEVLASIVITILLAFVVLTSARERYRSDIEGVVRELNAASQKFEQLIKDNADLTVRAVEHRLLRFNAHIARYLLKVRYGELDAKRIEDEAPNDKPG